MIIDESLSWNEQVDNICKKSSAVLGQLHRQGYMIPLQFRKTLYESLFLSTLQYCLPIWGATSASNISRIDKILNRGITGVFCVHGQFSHITNLRKELKWLSSEHLIIFETQKLWFITKT